MTLPNIGGPGDGMPDLAEHTARMPQWTDADIAKFKAAMEAVLFRPNMWNWLLSGSGSVLMFMLIMIGAFGFAVAGNTGSAFERFLFMFLVSFAAVVMTALIRAVPKPRWQTYSLIDLHKRDVRVDEWERFVQRGRVVSPNEQYEFEVLDRSRSLYKLVDQPHIIWAYRFDPARPVTRRIVKVYTRNGRCVSPEEYA